MLAAPGPMPPMTTAGSPRIGRLAPDSGPGLGHVRRRRLVPRVDEADVVFVQFCQEGVETPIQDAEHDADAFLLQTFE
jgi:hypothetical protein